MIDIKKQIHLVQTKDWNNFKQNFGTRIDKTEDIYILIKKIPFSPYFMGYAPKVNFEEQKINFESLEKYAHKHKIAFVRFDVPNILKDTELGNKWEKILSQKCKKASKNTFTKKNIYLDLSPTLEVISAKMQQKKRYNIKQAEKRGIKISIESNEKAFLNFWRLHILTAKNQGFLTHSKLYFNTLFETLGKNVYFVQAIFDNKVVTSWMIVKNNKTIYYVYGGSDPEYNRNFPNDLVGFNAIKLGKSLNAELFDMWGAEEGKGFTDFKLKYGGEMVEYILSYDFVINKYWHIWFNLLYNTFWILEKSKRKFFALIKR